MKTGTTDSIDVVVAKIFHPLRLEVPGAVVDDLMQKVDKALRQVERQTLERAEKAARNARICDSCQDRAGDAVEALLIRDSDAHDPGCGCNTCYTGEILREEESPGFLETCDTDGCKNKSTVEAEGIQYCQSCLDGLERGTKE